MAVQGLDQDISVILAALIIAEDEGFAGQGVATDVMMLGMPLIEMQARQAHAAGASHIVVATKQVPAALVAAMDRLRGAGINVVLARTAKEAADSIHPEETVLLMAPGCIADNALVRRLATVEVNVVAVTPLKAMAASREMIDAQHDWAGIARIDGNLIRQTATMLGDWALSSTLVRLALQSGAKLLNVEVEGAGGVQTVITQGDANIAVQRLVGQSVPGGGPGILGRPSYGVGGAIGRMAATASIRPLWSALLPLTLLAISAGMAGFGWFRTGLVMFAVLPVFGVAARSMIDAALSQSRFLSLFESARPWVGRAILAGSAIAMSNRGFGWGSIVLAAWLIWMLWEDRQAARKWQGDESSAALLVAAGLFAGYPVWGLGAALLHALATRLFASRMQGPGPVN
jgi:hypothetical protein